MKKHYSCLTFFILCISVITAGAFIFSRNFAEPKEYIDIDLLAAIKPDYSGVTIPANIAPLNFTVTENGSRYFVKIYSLKGTAISVSSRNGEIRIPLKAWKILLEANRGEKLFYDIYVKKDQWTKFQRIENIIAKEDIDSYIVYRHIGPIFDTHSDMGIYQRNLENYEHSVIMHNNTFGNGCINCHTFLNNRTDSMFIGTRSKDYGSATLYINDNKIEKVDTKFGYTAWHPSGKLAAYSAYKVMQFFHTSRMETRDALDRDSAILYYKIDSQTVETPRELSEKNRLEAHPAWTPDGKYLYYCSAPTLWKDENNWTEISQNYNKVKYDLRRVSYDVETDQWGRPETVLSADETGLSILLPRISPDGRLLLFCMCDYSCFAPFQSSSDLYLMDLQTGNYRKLDINSEHSESWHSWSTNSRWIAFSSKRDNGMFTRVYLSYIDDNGKAYKPFIIPQNAPDFYDSFPKLFNLPELISEPVRVNNKNLCRIACSKESIPVDIPLTSATPPAKNSNKSTVRQRERE